MKRRQFIALGGALLAAPISVSAQTGRKPVVGVLFYTNPEPVVSQLRDALARLGYRDGDTIQLDVRVADGSDAQLAEMAAELVARKVDMIIPVTTPAAIAAKVFRLPEDDLTPPPKRARYPKQVVSTLVEP